MHNFANLWKFFSKKFFFHGLATIPAFGLCIGTFFQQSCIFGTKLPQVNARRKPCNGLLQWLANIDIKKCLTSKTQSILLETIETMSKMEANFEGLSASHSGVIIM